MRGQVPGLLRTGPLVAAVSLWAAPALAHPGHDGASLAAGLAHPLTGLDHLLAMLAVGLLAARRGGRALALWPAAFVGAMLSTLLNCLIAVSASPLYQ